MRVALTAVSLGAVLAALAHGLPPQAFFSGDQGVKLVAAREALRHPGRPFSVPLPTIGGEPAPDLLGTFYQAHGDHAHALTSPVFPLVSAPLLALFGLRGLYVLPGVAWLLTLWLIARLGRALDPPVPPAWATAVAAGATPLLFYALEFWEHVPAVALTAAATLVVVRGEKRPRAWMLAGLLTGVAFLFRPEAVCYGLAIAVVWRAPGSSRAGLLAGFAAAQLPLLAYNLGHFGSPVGPHVSANAAGALGGWWQARGAIAEQWFLRGGAPAVLAALVLAAALGLGPPRNARLGRLLALAATAWVLGCALVRCLPRESLLTAFPLVGLAFAPLVRRAPTGTVDGIAALRRLALAFVALAWLSAPNDGGAQWGPRYLLPACVPLALVVADALRGLREWWRPRWSAVLCVVALLAGAVWVQRSSYWDLRLAKRLHARILTAVGEHGRSARVVLSDVWWLDQLTAARSRETTVLYAETPDRARSAVERLAAARVSPVLVVRSAVESPGGPTEVWLSGSGYVPEASARIEERGLSFLRIRCRPPEAGGVLP